MKNERLILLSNGWISKLLPLIVYPVLFGNLVPWPRPRSMLPFDPLSNRSRPPVHPRRMGSDLKLSAEKSRDLETKFFSGEGPPIQEKATDELNSDELMDKLEDSHKDVERKLNAADQSLDEANEALNQWSSDVKEVLTRLRKIGIRPFDQLEKR